MQLFLASYKNRGGKYLCSFWLDKQHEKKGNIHFYLSEGMTLKCVLDSVLSVFSFSFAGGMPCYDKN